MAKSVVKGKKPKTVTSDASVTSTTKGTSLNADNTPRTTIQNLLREGTCAFFDSLTPKRDDETG